jgi:signal peptidase II
LKYKTLDNLTKIALALVISGGFGNMIDRCFYGESLFNGSVIDFIDFCAFPKIWSYIFNIADSCVVVGTVLLMISIIMMEINDRKVSKKENTSEVTETCSSENSGNGE